MNQHQRNMIANVELKQLEHAEPDEEVVQIYAEYISYIVIGAILIVTNKVLFVNLMWHKVLRRKKEYLLLAGLVSADMLGGWAMLIAGAYRLRLIESHKNEDQMTHWACIFTPHLVVMAISYHAQAGMLFIISLDRLVFMLTPLRHHTFSRKYAYYLIGSCYFISIVYSVGILVHTVVYYDGNSTISTLCELGAVDNEFHFSSAILRNVFVMLSILVFLIVWCLYRNYQRRARVLFPSRAHCLRRTQRHLTTTVGICALFSFCFYVIPNCQVVIETFLPTQADIWGPICYILNGFNALVNVFVYSLRHKDIRHGLQQLFLCRELPSTAEQRLELERSRARTVTIMY